MRGSHKDARRLQPWGSAEQAASHTRFPLLRCKADAESFSARVSFELLRLLFSITVAEGVSGEIR